MKRIIGALIIVTLALVIWQQTRPDPYQVDDEMNEAERQLVRNMFATGAPKPADLKRVEATQKRLDDAIKRW